MSSGSMDKNSAAMACVIVSSINRNLGRDAVLITDKGDSPPEEEVEQDNDQLSPGADSPPTAVSWTCPRCEVDVMETKPDTQNQQATVIRAMEAAIGLSGMISGLSKPPCHLCNGECRATLAAHTSELVSLSVPFFARAESIRELPTAEQGSASELLRYEIDRFLRDSSEITAAEEHGWKVRSAMKQILKSAGSQRIEVTLGRLPASSLQLAHSSLHVYLFIRNRLCLL